MRRVFAPHLDKRLSREGAAAAVKLWSAWRRTLRVLRPLGGVSLDNGVEVLVDGDDVFERMWAAIDGARQRVMMTTYTLEPDAVGKHTLERLTAAAERGCEVTFVYDSFGSLRLRDGDLAALRRAGATVVAFNPVVRFGIPLLRLVRNHQKILVVDERLAFCGGMNVSEDYAGERHGNGRFRDTQLALTGPSAIDLGRLVADATGADELARDVSTETRESTHADDASGEGCLVQILESNVRRERRAIQRALRTTVVRSVERCYLTSPYFVPPARLIRALRGAAQRGVDVRVLTAGLSDVPIVRLASRHLYGRLLRSGVRIFEFEARTLHAKTTTIDGVYASVGSFNLDHWSDRRNLEVNVCLLDRSTAAQLEDTFRSDLDGAREVEASTWGKRGLWQRFVSWGAYVLMRI